MEDRRRLQTEIQEERKALEELSVAAGYVDKNGKAKKWHAQTDIFGTPTEIGEFASMYRYLFITPVLKSKEDAKSLANNLNSQFARDCCNESCTRYGILSPFEAVEDEPKGSSNKHRVILKRYWQGLLRGTVRPSLSIYNTECSVVGRLPGVATTRKKEDTLSTEKVGTFVI